MSVPVGAAAALFAFAVFAPLFVVSRSAPIPIGCLLLGGTVWISVAIHEIAHAVAAVAHRPQELIVERRGPTVSVLVSPAAGRWGVLYAVSGPLAGALICVPLTIALTPLRFGLIPVAVATVHMSNLRRSAPDGRFLRVALRNRG